MATKGKKAAAPRKKANGYKMPAPIAAGEVIHDTVGKKKWRIGPSIGVGGFGEIYSACDHEKPPKSNSSYPYVIKIEPHENGPLFVEKHFYVRNANKDDIAKFMASKKLSSFGMPTYVGNGSHEYKGEKYRYLVLERYGKDVWSFFKDCGRSFPPTTVFQIGLQMLDVLEYIHSRGYVHADIKGANILMGLKKGTENQAYLVDFGLATRINDKEFKPDPKCAHNGTIEYTSRDAHLGVPTMRGDLEILGYNMLQWLVGELPWEKSLKQPKTVQDMKEALMKNVRSNITKQYSNVPDALIKFFEYINTMKPKDTPDYTKCKQLFESYLKSEGKNRTSKIVFSPNKETKNNKRIADVDNDSSATDKIYEKNKKKNSSPIKKARAGKAVKVVVSDSENERTDEDDEEVKNEKNNRKKNPSSTKRARAGKVVKAVVSDSENERTDEDDEEVKDEKNNRKKNSSPIKRVRAGKAVKVVVSNSVDEKTDEDDEELKDEKNNRKKNSSPIKRLRTGKAVKVIVSDSENEKTDEDDEEIKVKRNTRNVNDDAPKTKRTRKPKVKKASPESDDCENEEPDSSSPEVRRKEKRKQKEFGESAQVKKVKKSPKATPPAKKNHVHISTQTSVEKRRNPRQVSFDSPISEIIGEKRPFETSKQSANSSGDIFEDSFVIEEKKIKPKKRFISDEEITVKKIIRKKITTTTKAKSWKDRPAILNGRSPPK